MDLAVIIKDHLVAQGVGTFAASSGWSLHVNDLPDDDGVPDTIVAIFNSGGSPSNPKWLLDFPHIQVRVRSAVNGYNAAWAKSVEIHDLLLGLPAQDVSGGRIDSITAIGHINPLGQDDKRRHSFSMNFALIVEPTATAETNRDPL